MEFEGMILPAALVLDSMVIMALVLLSCRLLSNASASLRHQLVAGAFITILLLPVLIISMPSWDTTAILDPLILRGIFGDAAPVTVTGEAVTEVTVSTGAAVLPGPGVIEVARQSTSDLTDFSLPPDVRISRENQRSGPVLWALSKTLRGRMRILLFAVWAAGAVSILIVQLVRWAGAGFVAEMSSEHQDPVTASIAERVRKETGLEGPVTLLRSEMTAVTMAWGIFKNYIILPSDSDSWSIGKMEEVLRHEMAHLKRRDNMVLIIAVLACAIYWFNPLVWKALKRLHYEREVSCDDFVLNLGGTASSYARHLMEISIKLSDARNSKIIPAAMAHSSDVKKRLVSVLDPTRNRRPAGFAASMVCVLLVIGLAMPVAAFRPWEVRAAHASGNGDFQSLDVESIESILASNGEEGDKDEISKKEIKKLRKRLAELKKERARLHREQRELRRQIEEDEMADQKESSRSEAEERSRSETRDRTETRKSSRSRGVSRTRERASVRTVDRPYWKVEGTICSGEDRYRLDRTTLENCDRGYRVESKDVLLDPDSDDGLTFESGSGFLKITSEEEDRTIEYRLEPSRDGGSGEIEKTVRLNGSEVPLDRRHSREIRKIVGEITDLLEDVGIPSHGISEIYLPDLDDLEDLTLIESIAPPSVPSSEVLSIPDFEDGEGVVIIVNGEVVSLDDERDHPGERSIRILKSDLLSREMESQREAFEEFAEVFEDIKDHQLERFDDYGTGRTIEEIYHSRQPRIEKLIRDSVRMAERKGEYEKAVRLVAEILDEYSEVALRSIDAIEDNGPREELITALNGFYRRLGDSAREALDDIDEDDVEKYQSAKELYEELLKNARETCRKIERK